MAIARSIFTKATSRSVFAAVPRLIPENATVAVGDVTSVPFGDPPTVTNVGTPSSVILDFEIPNGEQGAPGVVQAVVAGSNISVDNTDPANPVISGQAGTVTAVSVASANGFAGSSSGGATPALTLSTTITGVLQGNGTAVSAASTTGSGSVVLATSPSLTTPALGTPSAAVLTNATGLPISTGLTGAGTGVLTALGVNVGSAGAFVTFNGALGTPSSGTLTNATGLPVAGIASSTSTALGVGSLELGHATDTTLSRGAAGFLAVEGKRVPSPASQASGDILYRDTTEWARLAKGTAYQQLRMNSGATAPEWATAREVLTANRTYYVLTTGSDSNTGLVNNAGGAFLTLQKAWDTIVGLDLGGYVATIQIGDGTYTSGITSSVSPVGGTVVINGNSGTPANVIVSTTSASCIYLRAPCVVTLQNFEVRTTTSESSVRAVGGADITIGTGMRFGASAEAHMRADTAGIIQAPNSYAVTGGAGYHWFANGGSIICSFGTVTITGTPAFSVAWAVVSGPCLIIAFSMTFSGSATGARYNVTLNGVVNTFGGGATYLPGNAAGSTATGGQYA